MLPNKTNHNDQRDQKDFARNFTKIYTDSKNSFELVNQFAKEFFYDLMFDESKGGENSIVIKDAANDLVYEMRDFSKDNESITFTMETIDKYKGRPFNIMKIKDGEIIQDEKVEKKGRNNQRNGHLRGNRKKPSNGNSNNSNDAVEKDSDQPTPEKNKTVVKKPARKKAQPEKEKESS